MYNALKLIAKLVVPGRLIKPLKQKLGMDIYPLVEYDHLIEHLGSDYGGWEVITGELANGAVVYSFGIGEDVSFDVALMTKYGITIHAFDPTPRSIVWLKQQSLPHTFHMHEFGLADFDGQASFYAPENPKFVSYTLLMNASRNKDIIQVPVYRLETIMKMLGHNHVDVLKMDIEGAEYQVLEDLKNSLIRPGQILVEFHHRFPKVGIKKTKKALVDLREMGYRLFSVSSNGLNYGFILAGSTSYRSKEFHPAK
jgi:FkbM family methyltransferase